MKKFDFQVKYGGDAAAAERHCDRGMQEPLFSAGDGILSP